MRSSGLWASINFLATSTLDWLDGAGAHPDRTVRGPGEPQEVVAAGQPAPVRTNFVGYFRTFWLGVERWQALENQSDRQHAQDNSRSPLRRQAEMSPEG